MSNNKEIFLFIIFTMVSLLGCNNENVKDNYISESTKVTEVKELKSGDAKFFNNYVVTSVDGILTLIGIDGKNKRVYQEINSNWIDVIEQEKILVYGNFNNEIGIIRFDDDYNIVNNDIVMNTTNLQIDPTITVIDGVYFMTVTEIIGNVNNADKGVQNGEYILHMFKSKDLKDWEFVSDIADEYHNIEDVDIVEDGGTLLAIYEKEQIDKGESSVILKESDDDGKTWSDAVELLSSDADHEPAVFEVGKENFVLYYSSDRDNVGESYMGARVYYSIYNKDYNSIKIDQPVVTENLKGILLYDIKKIDEDYYLLYSHDYLTTNDLIIEKSK